jgi:hypothetical protein
LQEENALTIEICCETLDKIRFAEELREIMVAIEEQSKCDISVMYGFGCTNAEKNQWGWIHMPATGLPAFITASVEKGIYEQGGADLYIEVPSLAVEVTLCHECDIHIKSEPNDFLEHFRLRWLLQGIKVWFRTGDNAKWEEASLPH